MHRGPSIGKKKENVQANKVAGDRGPEEKASQGVGNVAELQGKVISFSKRNWAKVLVLIKFYYQFI